MEVLAARFRRSNRKTLPITDLQRALDALMLATENSDVLPTSTQVPRSSGWNNTQQAMMPGIKVKGSKRRRSQGSPPPVPRATAPPAASATPPSTVPAASTTPSTAPPASAPSAVQITSTLPSTAPPTAHSGRRAATQPKRHKYTSAPSSGAEAHTTGRAPGPQFLFYVPPEYNYSSLQNIGFFSCFGTYLGSIVGAQNLVCGLQWVSHPLKSRTRGFTTVHLLNYYELEVASLNILWPEGFVQQRPHKVRHKCRIKHGT
ncbi:hypothetical protein GGX14DRAFT_651392 [Mycena pura]|uniref:Uncharacterized protein n=1 Tax=Mycena pura TaxID=153505 RepID=A0AAD7E2L3_9AGAR|nr:hypothetical protein GGX14DRAFT_651392 [Mycena pura]